MKRLVQFFLLLFVVALLAVPQVQAGCRVRCLGSYSTSPSGSDPSDWGMGSSCAAAYTDLDNHLYDRSDAQCVSLNTLGVCGTVQTVITTECYWRDDIGMYQADGYAIHSCEVEICIDPVN